MNISNDVLKIWTMTLPNGKTQEFQETSEGVFFGSGCSKVTDWEGGFAKVKAAGGSIECRIIRDVAK